MTENKVTEQQSDLQGATFAPALTPVRMGIDVGSNTLLHMHLPRVSSHIQIGTIGTGIYGGLK